MDYLLNKVKENIYVFSIWDASWNSYNNCYLIIEEDGVTLIDSCKAEHAIYLEQALSDLGKKPEDIQTVLATHGHEDHVEGSILFKNAKKLINTREQVPENLAFLPELSDSGTVGNFTYSLVGFHTPGSLIYYHRPTKTLFSGDFLCFFGDPLSSEGLVSKGEELREAWINYLQGGGVPAKDIPNFLHGLAVIMQFESDFMCTGHGGVLAGQINGFINKLLMAGKLQVN